MLKAFDTIEAEQMDTGIVDERIFAEERRLALDFVRQNPASDVGDCPICGNKNPNVFMEIENTIYLRCKVCGSIFVSADGSITCRYKAYEPLVSLRCSQEYQANATQKRSRVWEDLAFWLRFRCARYLGRGEDLNVILHGSHHQGLADTINKSGLCGKFRLEASILSLEDSTNGDAFDKEKAEVLLYLDQLSRETEPLVILQNLRQRIRPGGLLILSTRVGSGIDILTLKGNIKNLFPYEHSLLSSIKGLEILLQKSGFELLEMQTPGTLDVKYLCDNLAGMGEDNLYLRYLLETADKNILAEFQNFLQKSGTSSHARVVARKNDKITR